MSSVKLDMAGRPLPNRTYPAETGSAGYTLHERTLGQWLEYWAETTPDKEYIVYSDRDLRFTWSKFNERVDNLAKGLIAIGVKKGWSICARTLICILSVSPMVRGIVTMWI